MKHQYDLFEKFPDGSSLWKASVIGLEGAHHYMRDLAQRSPNRFYALHLVSGKIVFHERPGHRTARFHTRRKAQRCRLRLAPEWATLRAPQSQARVGTPAGKSLFGHHYIPAKKFGTTHRA